MLRSLLTLPVLLPSLAFAAASALQITPLNTSVRGGESQAYSARFFDALARPVVGEAVSFSNDACGSFDNGEFSITVLTDITGVATANFTARPQGITCQVTLSAGVTVRYNVFTYTAPQVSIVGATLPAEVRPGQPYTFSAGANAGAYPIYNADITARVVSGAGSLAPSGGNSGQSGRVEFTVKPDPQYGAFEIEVAFRTFTRRFVIAAPELPLQDMWWAGSGENGWGMSIVQHRDSLFSAIYAYDDAGRPTWYVMPGGAWNEARTAYTGALYRPRGTPYSSYDATRLVVGAPVGSATITFDAANAARLAYTIDGVAGTKAIERQQFGPVESTEAPARVADMWWGGSAQNGWGIALLQQYRTLFGVWFTYDASGAPTWFVMPSGFWKDYQTWEGRLYRTVGSPWVGRAYDAAALRSIDVGEFTFRFDGGTATFSYTIDGVTGTMPLERQPF